jgi:hypothetical protein
MKYLFRINLLIFLSIGYGLLRLIMGIWNFSFKNYLETYEYDSSEYEQPPKVGFGKVDVTYKTYFHYIWGIEMYTEEQLEIRKSLKGSLKDTK